MPRRMFILSSYPIINSNLPLLPLSSPTRSLSLDPEPRHASRPPILALTLLELARELQRLPSLFPDNDLVAREDPAELPPAILSTLEMDAVDEDAGAAFGRNDAVQTRQLGPRVVSFGDLVNVFGMEPKHQGALADACVSRVGVDLGV